MTVALMSFNPSAMAYTDNDIVGKINTATTQITRATCVSAAARVITVGEINNTHINSTAGITYAKLNITASVVNVDISASASIGGTKLAPTAAKDNLDALAPTARGYIITNPSAGQFKIIAVERDAAGLLNVEYDNVTV